MSDPTASGDTSRPALPDDFVARLRALSGGAEAAPAKPAATVVLLRDVDDEDGPGIEACLLRRVSTMAFAAGMHVFPGGGVDREDMHTAVTSGLDGDSSDGASSGGDWAGPPPDSWAGLLSADVGLARALVCAAVRETFEESGVLLAGGPSDGRSADSRGVDGQAFDDQAFDGEVVDTDPTRDPSWETDRTDLIEHRTSLSAVLARRGLRLRADLLRPWAHWITPEVEPKRYDTRFFVAAMPSGQASRHVGGESDRMVWMRPQAALDLHEAGGLAMLPPTAFTLAELSQYESVEKVLAAANERDVKPVLPRVVITGEQAELLLPSDPGYAEDG